MDTTVERQIQSRFEKSGHVLGGLTPVLDDHVKEGYFIWTERSFRKGLKHVLDR